jgi:hypothetical protein
MVKRIRGLVCLLAVIGAGLVAVSPAAADSVPCSSYTTLNSSTWVEACLHFGWGADVDDVASSGYVNNYYYSASTVDMQTCLWLGDQKRIGCSPYEWVSPGSRVVYNSNSDWAPAEFCSRLWVPGKMVAEECAWGN